MTHDDLWLRARLSAIAPDLAITAFTRTEGQFNTVVMLNHAWVFRFPKSPAAAATLAREVGILRALAGKALLPIPDPVYSDGSLDPERAYMGYRLLPGVPIERMAVEALPKAAARDIAGQLTAFLRALHGLPKSLLPGDEEPQDRREEWVSLYEGFRAQLFGFMRPDARDAVAQAFTQFLETPANFAWEPVIRHGDLGGSNLLWDSTQHRLTGVIDFASCGLGDPAVDLAALSTLDPRLRDLIAESYGFDANAVRRAEFYRGAFALQEAYYGWRDGDRASFDSGLAGYR